MSRRHADAWRIDATSASDHGEYAVLVKQHSYWWLLCPVTATLYVEAVDKNCSDSTCLWDDLHEAARAQFNQLVRG